MPILKCSSGKATPSKAIAYITDKKKAALVSVRNLFEDEDYAKQFNETAKRCGKGKKYEERKYYHFKLSCAREDNVSPQKAQRYAEELAKTLFPEGECVIATHTDTKTIHSHIVLNAVNPATGKKFHFSKDEYGKMKDEANRIGKKFGFTPTEFRKSAKNKRTAQEKHIILKGGTSWKEELREVIHEAIGQSRNEQEFKEYLQKCYGVEITRSGKDFSYLHPDKQRAIRGERLGTNYTKSEVLRKIGEQNNRKKTVANSGERGNNSSRGQSRIGGIGRGGTRSNGLGAGWLIAESIGALEREMQQLSQAAELACAGLDTASQEYARGQQPDDENLDGKDGQNSEENVGTGKPTGSSDEGNGSGNSGSGGNYGK